MCHDTFPVFPHEKKQVDPVPELTAAVVEALDAPQYPAVAATPVPPSTTRSKYRQAGYTAVQHAPIPAIRARGSGTHRHVSPRSVSLLPNCQTCPNFSENTPTFLLPLPETCSMEGGSGRSGAERGGRGPGRRSPRREKQRHQPDTGGTTGQHAQNTYKTLRCVFFYFLDL